MQLRDLFWEGESVLGLLFLWRGVCSYTNARAFVLCGNFGDNTAMARTTEHNPDMFTD